ncbi:MAG: hypothetical protein ACKVN8_03440 [Nitrosarchaeum sp.]
MNQRNLEKSDSGYKVYLYIFYVCGFIMVSSLIFGVYVTMIEWMKNGTYVMGEVIQNTFVPFDNFARVSTWIFFSTIIGWYCVTRIGWKRTAGNKIVSWKMALLQLMLLAFVIITLYEVLYNFTVLNSSITAGMIQDTIPNIDMLSIAYPDANRPWNLVFATKVFLAALIITSHAFYLSTKPRKSLEEDTR